jgi:hypothetical protein
VCEPNGRRWSDQLLHRLGVASGLAGLLLQEAEAVDELGKVIWSRKPKASHPPSRRTRDISAKFFGAKIAEHEIHRLACTGHSAHVGDGKGSSPPARRALRRCPGNVDQPDHRRSQRRRDAGEMMAVPQPASSTRRPGRGAGPALVTCAAIAAPTGLKCRLRESRSVVELLRAIAAGHQAASAAVGKLT